MILGSLKYSNVQAAGIVNSLKILQAGALLIFTAENRRFFGWRYTGLCQ